MKARHILTLVLSAALCGCHGGEGHEGHESHDHEAHHHEEETETASTADDHGNEIDLHDEVAERFGVRFDTIRPGDFHEVVRVSGRADASVSSAGVVSAPVAGTVKFAPGINACSDVAKGTLIATVDASSTAGGDINAAAKSAMDAAKRELDRITPLYNDRLVTATEYNNARAAYEQAAAAYSPRASGGRVYAPITGCITALNVAEGQYVDAGQEIASITSDREITLRVELPRRYLPMASTFTEAVIEQPYSEPRRLQLSHAHSPMGQPGSASAFVPLFFTIPHEHGLTPGATFTAYLTGRKRDNVITVPLSGISEQQGSYFIYERVHPEAYVKRRVSLGVSDGERVEITGGIAPGAVVVTEGATAVRLAETGSAIPEGHTHNH